VILVVLATSVVAAAHAPAAASQAAPRSPCTVPDALLAAGEKAEARKLYVAILKRNPGTPCARNQLTKLNAPADPKTCTGADALFDAGELPEARDAYVALGAEECAVEGLVAIRSVERLCAEGDAHLADGRNDEALEAYSAALEKNPKAQCALDGVDEADAGVVERGFTWIEDQAPNALTALGVVLTLLFLTMLLAYIPGVDSVIAHLPVVGKILSPRLTLGPLDDDALPDTSKVGGPMAARIKERLQRFSEEALRDGVPDYDLDFGNPGEQFATLVSGSSQLQNALEKARDVSEHTKVLGAIVDLIYALLPIRRLSVIGVIDPADGTQASATLSLEHNSRLEAAARVTGRDLGRQPTSMDFLLLTLPAAVWVQYEVARALSRHRKVEPDAAESFSLLREGIERHRAADEEGARRAYEEALALYPGNWAARVNLALTEARLSDDYERAVEILAEARDEMVAAS
jgi:tetratricopeptide (TPR) repeat protein